MKAFLKNLFNSLLLLGTGAILPMKESKKKPEKKKQ